LFYEPEGAGCIGEMVGTAGLLPGLLPGFCCSVGHCAENIVKQASF
jgi:hypothetical protein